MVTKTLCSIVLLLQTVFTVTWSQEPIDMCACRYRFVEQPPNSIMCNPYPTGQFITRCIVTYSANEGIPLSIVWHSKRHSNEDPQPLTSGHSTTTMIESYRIQSELTIELTEGMEQNYESFQYSCSVHFHNGTGFATSQPVFLFPRSVLNSMNGFDFPACNESSALSNSMRIDVCIDPNYNRPPLTTPPPPPPTTPATTMPPPTTTSPTTPPLDLTTTTVPPDSTTPPPTTTMAPPPTTPNPPTTPPPPPTTPPPTTPPPPVTTRQITVSRNNPLTFEEEILLYSAIVAAVILVVVIVVLVLCLCCWNRVCQRSRYCTCYSKY